MSFRSFGSVDARGCSGSVDARERSGCVDARGRSVSSWTGAVSGVDFVSSWTAAGSGVDSMLAADGCGLWTEAVLERVGWSGHLAVYVEGPGEGWAGGFRVGLDDDRSESLLPLDSHHLKISSIREKLHVGRSQLIMSSSSPSQKQTQSEASIQLTWLVSSRNSSTYLSRQETWGRTHYK